jgi:hypothetical protein
MRELPKDYLKQMSDIFDKKASKLQTGTTVRTFVCCFCQNRCSFSFSFSSEPHFCG